tara:strand:- start:122 stop:481 length:360 start_codon:yes stop_codon:yes gene_type:complete
MEQEYEVTMVSPEGVEGFAVFVLGVEYEYVEGSRGCATTNCPPDPDECEVTGVCVESVVFEDEDVPESVRPIIQGTRNKVVRDATDLFPKEWKVTGLPDLDTLTEQCFEHWAVGNLYLL